MIHRGNYNGPKNLDTERGRNKIYSSMMRKQYTAAFKARVVNAARTNPSWHRPACVGTCLQQTVRVVAHRDPATLLLLVMESHHAVPLPATPALLALPAHQARARTPRPPGDQIGCLPHARVRLAPLPPRELVDRASRKSWHRRSPPPREYAPPAGSRFVPSHGDSRVHPSAHDGPPRCGRATRRCLPLAPECVAPTWADGA